MAGSSGGNNLRRGKIISEINVTPLVDIMLVLLIIFMVTTTVIVRDAIEVKLPEAATGEPHKVSLIAVTINEKGELAMNGNPTTENQVRSYIRQERRQGNSMEAVIAADKQTNHGRVVQIIDLLRSEGVIKFAINVLRKEK